MSGYANTPPGTAQVATTRYARRVLMAHGAVDTSGSVSSNGMGRLTVRGRMTAGVPGAVLVVRERIEGQSYDEIGRFALGAVNTTYTRTFHVAGSEVRVELANTAAGDGAAVTLDLSATS